MTSVMRALATRTDAGPRIPRVAIVRGGRVVEERLVKQAANVTIGSAEEAMFVVNHAHVPGLPPSFVLLERVGEGYWLRFADGMSGRLTTTTGIHSLEDLRKDAHQAGGAYRLALAADARGKIVVGDATILFQIVPAPPVQPHPQLPLGVKRGIDGSLDWPFTIVAAMSFLVHFGIAGAMYSDWLDPVVSTEHDVAGIVDLADRLPKPPPETVPTPDHVDLDRPALPTPPTTESGTKSATQHAGQQGQPGQRTASSTKVDDNTAAQLAAEADKIEIGLLASVRTGPATQKSLDASEIPPVDLTTAAASRAGVTHDTGGLKVGHGGAPVTAGKTSLATVAGTTKRQGQDGAGADNGPASGPSIAVETRPPSATVAISDADRVIANLRPRFRQCYQAGLDTNPSMSGRALIVAKVGPNGEVQSVEVGPTEGLSEQVASCVARHVKNATFTGNGSMTTLRIPVTFLQNK